MATDTQGVRSPYASFYMALMVSMFFNIPPFPLRGCPPELLVDIHIPMPAHGPIEQLKLEETWPYHGNGACHP